MGKGDKKTRRGKITAGSYGKSRPKKTSKKTVVAEKPVKAKPAEEVEAKPKTTKPKAEKAEETAEKPKKTTARKKKTEE